MTKRIFLLCFIVVSITYAQREITLEDIWKDKTFYAKRMLHTHSMKDGEHYAEIENTKGISLLNKYSYVSQKMVGTLVSSVEIPRLSKFSYYKFSDDEQKVILSGGLERIYRRSTKGKFYVFDLSTKKYELIYDGMIREPEFSPDGRKVSFVFENNIYIKNLESGVITAVTTDGVIGEVINGVTDWVYEEEFSFVKAYHWNPTSEYMVFLRFDESNVPEFSMDIYGKKLYPSIYTFKYPKAGETNSKVTLHTYRLSGGKTTRIALENDYYIPRIKWTKAPYKVSVQTLNRHQNHLDITVVDVASGEKRIVLDEKDPAYVDITDDLIFIKGNKFLRTSERDGYRHIYLYSGRGKMLKQVTKGDWEVTDMYGYDSKNGILYYQSTKRGSIYRDVYMTDLNGKHHRRLTENKGQHYGYFSADMTYFIDEFSNSQTPYQYTLYEARTSKKLKSVITNKEYSKKLESYSLPKKEFSTLDINGENMNMWMIKPKDFDPDKTYPLFITQYSGPGSQEVSDNWHNSGDFWYIMLAQKGYIVACMDGRGTGYKGAEFKKVTYRQLGKYEVEDQIEFARQLGKLKYIDANRIGIWGWSYGGFMSSNCILEGADVFKMAIAVAPVTSWRFYDSVYTERYMQTPQENPGGYDDNSPLSHVDKLKGDFLLIHGSADDNVHVQNSMRMISALVKANKDFDWAIYPDKNHGIYGGDTRLQLYRKMTKFIEEKL